MNGDDPDALILDTELDAARYLKYFCHAVHEDDGAFSIINSSALVFP